MDGEKVVTFFREVLISLLNFANLISRETFFFRKCDHLGEKVAYFESGEYIYEISKRKKESGKRIFTTKVVFCLFAVVFNGSLYCAREHTVEMDNWRQSD